MSREQKIIGEFEQLILLAILHVNNRSYGIEISNTLLSCCKREVSLGALYTTLSRMQGKGLVTSEMGEASAQRGGKAKKYFIVTAEGQLAVKNSLAALEALSADVNYPDLSANRGLTCGDIL